MSLIIALILICYFACRKGYENTTIRTNRQRMEDECKAKFAAKDEFLKKYTDPYAEDDCLDEVENCGEDYRRIYSKIERETLYTPTPSLIYLALMAERMKIPHAYAESGFSVTYFHQDMRHRDKVESRRKLNTFMKWYDTYLRSFGFPHKIEFMTSSYTNAEMWDIYDMDEEKLLRGGVYCWKVSKIGYSEGKRLFV